ncbi:MAG: ATP-dependent DNA helicase RecG [Bacteroidales bacterium]|nr:ATP-dependent DNA helicase RecG [Bacteroidales bacterium]
MSSLQNPIQFLPGIGPKRAEILAQDINLVTVEDLLLYFPYKHVDRSRFYKIKELTPDLPYLQIIGKIVAFNTVGEGIKKRLTATFVDETGMIELVWFQGIKWVQQTYTLNTPYIIFGKPNYFNGKYSIPHPEIEPYKPDEHNQKAALQPYYNTSERMKKHLLTSRWMHKIITYCLEKYLHEVEETLPSYLINRLNLLPLREALMNIHLPRSIENLKKAEYRLKFEELFAIQLNLAYQKSIRKKNPSNLICKQVGNLFHSFYQQNLPFELTNAQKRVIKEIRKDLGSGHQMNRLLQGDVGSGKTLVALMTMLIALDNGFQTCLMAPTEILANQHYVSFVSLLKNLPINIELLTGSTKKSVREKLMENLVNGSTHILIGTHALIEDAVQFKNLGLVIIDEQHRFGVAQRAKLWQKNDSPPHVLVMTATPIPRTLAMTLYGDLDVSVIDELPPGRKPIITKHFTDALRDKVFELIKREIAIGRQVYIIYPLIKESEKLDLKALEKGYHQLQKVFPPPTYSLCMIHGQMKPSEKDEAMKGFIERKYQILVSTTVIEVGVNVPNASVMVIENAERFGLSQLHQLRGRVGRGAEQSYCILLTSHKLSEDALKRMQIMEASNDGFVIAEADLKLRGPGDIEGTQQSGMPFELHIANLAKDQQILMLAKDIATEIIEKDPHLSLPENLTLKELSTKNKKEIINWSRIS